MARARKIDRVAAFDEFDDDDVLRIHPVPSKPAVETVRILAGGLHRYRNPSNDREILLCDGCRRVSRPAGMLAVGKVASGRCRGCRGVVQ